MLCVCMISVSKRVFGMFFSVYLPSFGECRATRALNRIACKLLAHSKVLKPIQKHTRKAFKTEYETMMMMIMILCCVLSLCVQPYMFEYDIQFKHFTTPCTRSDDNRISTFLQLFSSIFFLSFCLPHSALLHYDSHDAAHNFFHILLLIRCRRFCASLVWRRRRHWPCASLFCRASQPSCQPKAQRVLCVPVDGGSG